MENNLELINTLLQQISEELKARNVEIESEALMQEIEFLQWVRAMEDEYSAYSYCEE